MEHHAVLHPIENLSEIEVVFLKNDSKGNIDINELESYLKTKKNALVSLMHGNNEIGNMIDLKQIGQLCKENNALFHSDTVQTLGKFEIDLQAINIDYITGAAHKFYGPKGVGFMYVNANSTFAPYIDGGAQERNMRGGTENLPGIIGMAEALELAYAHIEERKEHILGLKRYFISELTKTFPDIGFNGASGDIDNSLYHLVNVRFPAHRDNQMLLFSLDIEGLCVSGGSACRSGTYIGSHVLGCLDIPDEHAHIRLSSRYNHTKEVLD